jgi:AmpD protein
MITNSKEMIINDEGFVQDIKHVLSPNCDARPKNISINLLVIHNISLPPDQYGGDYIEHFFTNRLNPLLTPIFKKSKI